jgi:hypothetical protein
MTENQAITHIGAISPNYRVEMTRNAKGEHQVSVRVYAETPEEAIKQAMDLYNAACAAYPFRKEG